MAPPETAQPTTQRIQSAIDSISSSTGYGRVIFPPETYLTATIHLKSGVVFDLHPNATIVGGTRIEDYPPEQERWYVVLAEDVEGVGITGGEEINGQGLKFVRRFDWRKNVIVSWNETGACFGDAQSKKSRIIKCPERGITKFVGKIQGSTPWLQESKEIPLLVGKREIINQTVKNTIHNRIAQRKRKREGGQREN